MQNIFESKYTQQPCTTNVSAWALKLPPSQKSVYLKTGVLYMNVTNIDRTN